MSRPLRLVFEGALYHITARGDRQEPIFEDDVDRHNLIRLFGQSMERFDASVFTYCLMSNHYHLVLQTRRANLSRLMRHINGVYTQAYNRRHCKSGHVFQGRFKAVLVDRDSYFLEVCRYVDLNPVRAGLVSQPQQWAWSSYRAHIGESDVPVWLDSAKLHRQIAPGAPQRDGPTRYAQFVAEGSNVRLWEEALTAQIYLGGPSFVQQMQHNLGSPLQKETPREQRQIGKQSLCWYRQQPDRNAAIFGAYLDGGYTLSAIADAFGLSVSRVSRLIRAIEAKGKT